MLKARWGVAQILKRKRLPSKLSRNSSLSDLSGHSISYRSNFSNKPDLLRLTWAVICAAQKSFCQHNTPTES
jgi:hypothetical protein